MIISPPMNTVERAEFDLRDLKKLFVRCQQLGISKDITIRTYVCVLKEAAGKEKFCEMFADFYALVEKRKNQINFPDYEEQEQIENEDEFL